jgi:hypothetical protein
VTQSSSFDAPMEADWHRMISEAAYYLAEKRGFRPGAAMDDWLEAELQVKEVLAGHRDAARAAQQASAASLSN